MSLPEPGTKVAFHWRKWDGSKHWEHECVYLGSDEWGQWLGQRVGWRSFRPGRDMLLTAPSVSLMPAGRTDHVLTVNAPPQRTRIYIDIAWDVSWRDGTPTAIDMDLDVVRRVDGTLFIDDEDEWAEHSELYGYPADVMAELERTTRELKERVGAHEPPFDEAVPDGWLRRLDELRELPKSHTHL
ncbi:DUF402 domain-containing protein [Microbacterium halophytorum]|uniref:DUF402 domain-containing protein n=1 Tax=Microbacterium halophytorum TaxID=2067568 RepID=UPI000CFBAA7D|nr:DUF402 domain-containing protein [Microbacterium halophytorum]